MVTQDGVWGSLRFPGSESEQHCLVPPGQSVEGATEGRATGEFPFGEWRCPQVMESERGGQETTGEAGLGCSRGQARPHSGRAGPSWDGRPGFGARLG